ncbi:MAG: lactate utilization protein [Bacteroidetes bacterium]|nr:lactate utilization protein [Bacteroidota bacterium]
MSETHQIFLQESAAKTGDLAMQLKLSSAARQYKKSFEEAVTQFSNLETAKRRVAFTRWKALENLDKYLIEFEANFIRSGGKVLWAQDAAEACAEIMAIVNRSANKNIVKAKTLTSEEIGLDEEFASHSQEWTETDLGQMILQLSGEKPMHMVMPAIHKDKKEVQQLFNDKLGSKVEDDTEALVSYASKFYGQNI